MKKRGRPSTYSEDIASEICARMVEGPRSLRSVCRDEDMPGLATVFQWLARHESFAEQYARACEARADADAEEIREIADTPVPAVIEKQELLPDPTDVDESGKPRMKLVVTERRVEDAVAHRRLQVDTRKWLMAKMRPKKYGEHHRLEHSGNIGLEALVAGDAKADE